jgi:flotillin
MPQAVISVVIVISVLFLFLMLYASRYIKVGPNQVLIVSGRRRTIREQDGSVKTVGFRVVKGGGAFVWPVFEKAEILSLEIMTLDVKLPEVYTVTGVPIMVDGVAQIKVRGEDVAISTAAEQFLSKTRQEIMAIALQTVEGHLRAIIGTMTVEEIYKNREIFAQRVQEVAAGDLANMGLMIVSFTLRDIRDNQGYLDALGRPRIAQVKRDAIIGQAEADRDATIQSAKANQAGQEAKYAADIRIAEAKRDFEMRQAEYQASVNEKKAVSDLAYDLQKYKTEQGVKKEEIQVQVIEKEQQIQVQEREIARKQKELQASVERPADADRYRIQTLAEAEKFKLATEAAGQAEAKRAVGVGEADANKARGLAEADVNRAKGLAEATVIEAEGTAESCAMSKKAAAWQAYNEAAIVQVFIDKLPEIARAIAEPLTKTEKIVIVSTGAEGSVGASKVTKDVIDMVAQLPPAVEALTGMKLQDLIARIPDIAKRGEGKKAEKKSE